MKQNGGLLRAIGRLRINFWIAMLLCVLCVGVTYGVASSNARNAFGSDENYAQAMKYLEVKNTIDDYYIGTVDEEAPPPPFPRWWTPWATSGAPT